MEDVIDGEVVGEDVAVGGELVHVTQPAAGALNLFGSSPAAAIEQMSEVARLLADILKQQKLYTNIQGKNHVAVEGWTLLGSLLGVFPVVVSTERVTEPAEGYKARVEARTLAGQVVGAGEALCTRAERMWKSRDEFALMAMAQTRATSRALRNPLGFVVKMAGYETAGAEEMPHPEPQTRAYEPPAETISDFVEPSQADLIRDVIGLQEKKLGKTKEAAEDWLDKEMQASSDVLAFLQRAKTQLAAKPDKAAS